MPKMMSPNYRLAAKFSTLEATVDSTYNAFTREVADLVHSLGLQKGLALDIGCGPGRFSLFLNLLGMRCVGLDFSARTAEKAKMLNRDVVCASATALPFRDESFKLAICIETLHHLISRYYDLALREAQRVVERGAWFVLDLKNSINLFLTILYRIHRSDAFPLFTRSPFRTREYLNCLGFGIYKATAIPYPVSFPNLVKFLAPKILIIARRARSVNIGMER